MTRTVRTLFKRIRSHSNTRDEIVRIPPELRTVGGFGVRTSVTTACERTAAVHSRRNLMPPMVFGGRGLRLDQSRGGVCGIRGLEFQPFCKRFRAGITYQQPFRVTTVLLESGVPEWLTKKHAASVTQIPHRSLPECCLRAPWPASRKPVWIFHGWQVNHPLQGEQTRPVLC